MVQAVEKAFRVLEAFDAASPRQTLTQLAESAGLDRSATQRFTHTLGKLGYLHKDARTKAYELTPKALNLAYQYTRSSPVVLRAHPYLTHLNRTLNETISLTVLDGAEVIFLSRYLSPNVLDTDVIVGSRLPAFCTAPGLALLATLEEAEVRAILAQSRLQPFTPRTIHAPDAIMARVAEARDRGFAVAEEQIYTGDISLAAPVVAPGGGVRAAVSLGASCYRYDAAGLVQEFAPALLGAARSIAQAIAA